MWTLFANIIDYNRLNNDLQTWYNLSLNNTKYVFRVGRTQIDYVVFEKQLYQLEEGIVTYTYDNLYAFTIQDNLLSFWVYNDS